MPQEFVIVKEVIATTSDSFDVHSTLKTSPEIFKQLFKVDYPSGLAKGDVVSKIPFGSVNLTLLIGHEIEWVNNTKIISSSPMTVGSWTLWTLLANHGFKLLDSRIWLTKNDKDSLFNGRQLAERVFVRDVDV
ncbi:hypothetical protein NAEGRDRAFT_80926 [Naegleria gruberi]|uniref:Uncharacterized protein n=1 Tax=Naegleria gruberi TaxID=5762 RepID=D2VR19_NAEGR|nr:uncharacterized protein NAEGRDRAFT_80926 [Naegleria gruberi]EFC40814.1 hypothetical protein NAEGRDRAFT_80926 [Naegleria gruberi]|eukprot:XP_002673558.1 hypothetical protein NAEGRDRAFT_80926 [Naegleria gruberi strain NEG-M]